MLWGVKNICGRPVLNDFTVFHHTDTVRKFPHN